MLPSRGLRPAHLAPLSSRPTSYIYANASRKFSSLPRTAHVPSSSRPTLLSAPRRTATSHIALNASSVRYGSWYAPWSWGRSSTPGTPTETVPVADFSNSPSPPAPSPAFEPEVTTATPEIAPAGIDKAAVTESTVTQAQGTSSTLDQQTLDDLLGSADPTKDVLPKVEFDPTQLIDHPGHLAELGLDYGVGLTTMFQKLLETVYLNSGWGWAGTIIATTVILRSGMFVFQALSSDKMAAMAAMKPVTGPLQEQLNAAIASGDKQKADLLKMQQAAILKPYMSGMGSMIAFTGAQAIVGFCAFRCLRAMGELPVPGMAHDGFLWFTDLSARDPYFILPAATTAIMYSIFKRGGETGVSDATEASSRKTLLTVMAFFIGLVTAFQASGLQLYFLTSGIIGAGTGYLLKNNGFRRFIRIRQLPTPESNEVFSKVIKGELKLKDIKGPDGKIRYQPPKQLSSTMRRNNATLAGGAIKIREGTTLPLHLRPEQPKIDQEFPDRDADFEAGPKGSLGEKLDYYRRNYRLAYIKRRMGDSMRNMVRRAGYDAGPNLSRDEEKRKRKAEQYEIERRRRFENRK